MSNFSHDDYDNEASCPYLNVFFAKNAEVEYFKRYLENALLHGQIRISHRYVGSVMS